MRVLTNLTPMQFRGFLGAAAVEGKPALPHGRKRVVLALVGFSAGTLLWVLYVYLMLKNATWPLYVAYGGIGACCGLALTIMPRLIGQFVSKQGYRLALRQYGDRAQWLTEVASRRLREGDGEATAATRNDLGVVAFLQHRYPEAVTSFTTARAGGASEAGANLLAALGELGRWSEAGALLEEYSGDGVAEANLTRLAGLTPDLALLQQLEALARAQKQPRVLVNLGVQALRRGDYPAARSALQTALQLAPALPLALANRGVLEYRTGQPTAALASMASAAALASDPLLWSNLGALLVEARDSRQAEQWLLKAERLQPRSAAIQINLGNAHMQAGRHAEALEAYTSALHLGEYVLEAHYNSALAFLGQGDHALASEALREAERLAPEDPEVLNNLGCLHFEQEHYETAQGYFERLRDVPDSERYRRNLIRAELAAGQLEAAQTLLDEDNEAPAATVFERGLLHLLVALKIKPETETHRQMRAFNLRNAVAAFREIIDAKTGPVLEATINRGLAELVAGEHKAAAEAFAEIQRTHANQPELGYLAGMCYILAGQREQNEHEAPDGRLAPLARELFLKARPFLEKAIEVPALHETVAYDLGLLHYLVGDYAKASEILRRVARNDSSAELLTALALALARHAQELQLQAQTAALLSDARKQQLKQESRTLLTSALHFFRQALQMAPEAPLTHANIGLAHMLRNDKGDVEQALHHWQLMHRHGDARARRTYEKFMQAVSPEAARRLQFQDMELQFRAVRVRDWVTLAPPQMAGLRNLIEPALDLPEWQLQARTPAVRRCLAYRSRVERLRQKLHRLAL